MKFEMREKSKAILFPVIFLLCTIVSAQSSLDSLAFIKKLKGEILQELKAENNWSKFSLKGYGVVNYYRYDYDTDKELTNKIDAERLNLYLGYTFNDRISFKSEIEFEHGGTGATLELDNQEEFGEFEQEIEAGGEVKIEQLYINFDIEYWLNLKVGRFKNYFGLAQNLDTPDEYFTTHRQEMENTILPVGFYEIGIEASGKIFKERIHYRLALTNGLDASGFSSRNWIRRGHQTRFEMATAESFALTTRIDYKFGTHKNTYAGFAFYIGDAAANRPKDDMGKSAYVTMIEGHITVVKYPWRFNTIAVYGNVENSALVSLRNSNLSNNLGVKRTPVGKNALGFSAEIGYDILYFLTPNSKQQLYPFLRYDFYDTLYRVEGAVVDNQKWERNSFTAGVNWFVHPKIIVKTQYNYRQLGSQNLDLVTFIPTGKKQVEKTFSMGIGFVF